MKRKLFSTLLCAFALLLLMGAGVEPDSSAALMIEEESTSLLNENGVLETGIPTGMEEGDENEDTQLVTEENAEEKEDESVQKPADEQEMAQIPEEEIAQELPELDHTFLIDGQPATADTNCVLINGVTYVAMGPAVRAICPEAVVTWDGSTRTARVETANLSLMATVGEFYAVANGRYLYAQDGIQMSGDSVMLPLRILTEAFDAKLHWDSATDIIYVTRGSGALVSGEQYYDQDALFWLSRVIFAESGNQPLKGKMAVGNVVLNRVENPIFPNSIKEVLAQKNQFSTYRGGNLANRTPNESSVIAAKLVLDGGVVEETRGALWFDSTTRSWASRNKTCIAVLGGHKFYA